MHAQDNHSRAAQLSLPAEPPFAPRCAAHSASKHSPLSSGGSSSLVLVKVSKSVSACERSMMPPANCDGCGLLRFIELGRLPHIPVVIIEDVFAQLGRWLKESSACSIESM